MLKKGYSPDEREEIGQHVAKKHKDLPAFWRDRYKDRMTDVMALRMQVSSLQAQLAKQEPAKPLNELGPKPKPALDEMQCKILILQGSCC